MRIEFGYSGDFELTLSHKPANMDFTEKNGCFIVNNKVDNNKKITIKF